MQYFFFDDEPSLPFNYLTVTRWVGSLGPPYDAAVSASTYLEFAAADLRNEGARGLVNAFGNVKRCIHITVDTLLHQYGLFPYARRLNFPARLALLDKIDVLPTSIIRNLNVERNAIEHDYVCPDRGRVEEALDVARLLQLAIERLLERVPVESVIGWRTPRRHAVMRLEPGTGNITFSTLRAPNQYGRRGSLRYFQGPLRTPKSTSFGPGISVASNPWKSVGLNETNEAEWAPILQLLVSIQRSQAFGITIGRGGLITTSVTFPFPFNDPNLQEVVDKNLQERLKNDATEDT